MRHILSIDVEDYFQVAAFFDVIKYDDWSQWPSRVVASTHTILDLLDKTKTQATFFVLGWVAERQPELIREIASRGHEIGCHGFSHQFVYRQSREEFRSETQRSKSLLEDIVGEPVSGYRAASYSVTPESRWALQIIAEAGFKYDSSVFPIRHDHYGMPGAPTTPHWAETGAGKILEFPLTTSNFGRARLPVAGGGYFRLYPYSLTSHLLHRHQAKHDYPFIFYLHPWEIDTEQPRVKGASLRSRIRHYVNLSSCHGKLARLIDEFDFGPMSHVAEAYMSDPGLTVHDYAE